MSWQSYIDDLIRLGNVSKAAMYGIDDFDVMASSEDLKCTAQEVENLAKVLKGGDPSELHAGGVILAGVKFYFLRYDHEEFVIRAKRGTEEMAYIKKTAKTIVIAICEPQNQHGATKDVRHMCDFVESAGH